MHHRAPANRGHRRPILWTLVLLACALVVATGPIGATHIPERHDYARQSNSSLRFRGIDGYVRVSGTVMQDPLTHFHAGFINLCQTSSCSSWVQTGGFQGTAGTGSEVIRSTTLVHMFLESKDGCGDYANADLGQPPTPNYPFYIYYSGVTETIGDCAGQRKFWFKTGSVTNPPAGAGWMSTNDGYALAAQETAFLEGVGQDWFGLDNSALINDSFGLHLLNASSSWLLWNATNAPGSLSDSTGPLIYVPRKAWSAFQAHD
jgi:hypothetical protein